MLQSDHFGCKIETGIEFYFGGDEHMKKVKLNYLWKDRRRRLGLPLSFTRYSMTEDRFFLETGFFSIRTEEVLLYRVRDISLERKLGQRIFGVGSIRLVSSDKTIPEIVIKNVKHPVEVKELIHRQVEEMKTKRRMRFGEISGDFSLGGDDDDLPDDEFNN